MAESFVFHADFIDHLPSEYVEEWAMYAIRYGIYGIEPTFEDVLYAELWRKIKDRIDADKEIYNKRLEYLRQYRENKKHLKHSECSSNNQNIQTNTLGVSVSDSVSVSEFVSEFESVSDSVSEASKNVDATTPSARDYSEKIFNLFKDAGLPCCKQNPISFMQMDFKNAMAYLHNTPELKGIHSDDVIGAVKNYISCISNPDKYIKSKMNFYSLVKSKIFYNLLPSNFTETTFNRYDIKPEPIEDAKTYIPDKCPNCSKSMLYWNQDKDRYICNSCKSEFTFTEIMGDYISTEEAI